MKVYVKIEEDKIVSYSEVKQEGWGEADSNSPEVQAFLTCGTSDCLEACKIMKKQELKTTLQSKISEPMIYNGELYQVDDYSRKEICDYADILTTETNIGWLGYDNTVKTFATVSDFIDFRDAVVSHIKSIRDEYNSKREQLTNATTLEEVEVITWS